MKKIIMALAAASLVFCHPLSASALFYNELYSDKQYIVSINPNYVGDLGNHMIVCIRCDLRRRVNGKAYVLEYVALDKSARRMQITKSEWYSVKNKMLSSSGDGKYHSDRLTDCEKGSFYDLLWDAVVDNSAEARTFGVKKGSFAKLYDFGDSTLFINRSSVDDRGTYKVAWIKWQDNKNGGWYLDYMALDKKAPKELVLKRIRYSGGKAVSFEERPFDKANYAPCSPRTSGELIWKAVMDK